MDPGVPFRLTGLTVQDRLVQAGDEGRPVEGPGGQDRDHRGVGRRGTHPGHAEQRPPFEVFGPGPEPASSGTHRARHGFPPLTCECLVNQARAGLEAIARRLGHDVMDHSRRTGRPAPGKGLDPGRRGSARERPAVRWNRSGDCLYLRLSLQGPSLGSDPRQIEPEVP